MSDLPPPPPDDSDWSSQPPPPPGQPEPAGPHPPKGTVTLDTGENVELASLVTRLTAKVLDFVILFVSCLIIVVISIKLIFGATGSADPELYWAGVAILTYILVLLATPVYEITFVALKGQTPGKMAACIKVVRADNGGPPGWGKSAGRGLILAVAYAAMILLLGLLVHISLLWDRRRQGWHDKAAGTLVIKV